MARRIRRTRVGKNRNKVVSHMVQLLRNDTRAFTALVQGHRNITFGRLSGKWLDNESKESIFDRYVDDEAKDIVSYAINIVAKEIREAQ